MICHVVANTLRQSKHSPLRAREITSKHPSSFTAARARASSTSPQNPVDLKALFLTVDALHSHTHAPRRTRASTFRTATVARDARQTYSPRVPARTTNPVEKRASVAESFARRDAPTACPHAAIHASLAPSRRRAHAPLDRIEGIISHRPRRSTNGRRARRTPRTARADAPSTRRRVSTRRALFRPPSPSRRDLRSPKGVKRVVDRSTPFECAPVWMHFLTVRVCACVLSPEPRRSPLAGAARGRDGDGDAGARDGFGVI